MAKRYHNSKSSVNHKPNKFNDEQHHDKDHIVRGMYEKPMVDEGYYAGMDARRRQEMQDAGYIREDHSAVANLPQHVIMKSYPKTGPYMPEMLEDSIEGVDAQMDYDDNKRREHFYPKKH